MKLKDIPPEFVKIYNLKKIAAPGGTIYVKIQKGMYDLPQAGILAQNLLNERLNKHGYHQSPAMPGLWQNHLRPISFTLCIDNFGIKYVGKNTPTILPRFSTNTLHRLDQNALHWDEHGLGLCPAPSPWLNA
jgi:hypothetical protein